MEPFKIPMQKILLLPVDVLADLSATIRMTAETIKVLLSTVTQTLALPHPAILVILKTAEPLKMNNSSMEA